MNHKIYIKQFMEDYFCEFKYQIISKRIYRGSTEIYRGSTEDLQRIYKGSTETYYAIHIYLSRTFNPAYIYHI